MVRVNTSVSWRMVRIPKPTVAGNTLQVECEVIVARATSKPDHGLMRIFNEVVDQRGEVVAAYNPLRMVKGRPTEVASR